jgi:hypothetical protein
MTMRHFRGLGQDGTLVRPTAEAMVPVPVAPTVKEIPYDYVAKFTLQGKRGNRVQDVITISIDGAFVAVAIGYSFIPARLELSQEEVLLRGVTLNQLLSLSQANARMVLQCLLVRLCGIDFKYSIVDSGTGRELQNQPIHNIAGLGKADGDRPFRPLAKPMLFMPRSTIRIEVEEVSEGPIYIGAELFIVLHGYKMLGYGTALP